MVNIENAIRTESRLFQVKGRQIQDTCYVFKCPCGSEISYTKWEAKQGTGLCRTCCNRRRALRPFESAYNKIRKNVKSRNKLRGQNITFELSYEEFFEFTKSPFCHYCGDELIWVCNPRSNLDRKDNNLGYSKENCVPCCRDCNTIKGSRFTYGEMMLLSPVLKKIRIAKTS